MSKYRFAGLDSNVIITAIGPLLKRHQQKKWRVTLQFYPRQSKSDLSLSHATILFRKAVLNPEEERKRGGWKQYVNVRNTNDWGVCLIRDCPILGFANRVDRDQFCFVFQAQDGKTVYLPQFELARVLFFYDSYFSRTSIVSTDLSLEFDIQRNQASSSAQVNVLSSSGYSMKHFNDPRSRMILSWILLDPEARRSYESIGKIQLTEGIDTDRYRLWHFKFDPPEMPEAVLHVCGRFDRDTNALFVYEISEVNNLRADVPDEIVFTHPKFAHPVCGDGMGGGFSPAPSPETLEVEDENFPDVDTATRILPVQGATVEFDKRFYTSKLTDKTKAVSYGRLDEEIVQAGELTVSMEEAVQGGRLASADWGNSGDGLDCGLLFENKFDCFMKMVDELVRRHGCRVAQKEVGVLRQVGRCSKHQLLDGRPRGIAAIRILLGSKEFRLLEVDTSDGRDSISTLLMRMIAPPEWAQNLENLEYWLVKSGLNWPKELLSSICGPEGFCRIVHPQTASSDKGVLEADSIGGWAERIYGCMERL